VDRDRVLGSVGITGDNGAAGFSIPGLQEDGGAHDRILTTLEMETDPATGFR
jgi:hypothetical protein